MNLLKRDMLIYGEFVTIATLKLESFQNNSEQIKYEVIAFCNLMEFFPPITLVSYTMMLT